MATPLRPHCQAPGTALRALGLPVVFVLILVLSGLGAVSAHPTGAVLAPASPARHFAPAVLALEAATAALAPTPSAASSPWANLTPNLTRSPQAREGAQMAYDPIDGQVLMFGGLERNHIAADTWAFSGGVWTNLTPGLSVSPPGRDKGGLVYDSEDDLMILFGGHAGSGYLNDTWSFNGTAWSPVISTVTPGPREDVAMADDPADHYVLLFGGEAPSVQLTNDTWTFVAGQWTNRTALLTSPAPPPREAGGLTYDGADGYILLLSGKSASNSLLSDEWTYSGGAWTNLTSPLNRLPPPREEMSLTYDFVDGYVLMFGGFHFPVALGDEWTYVGGIWTKQTPASLPPARLDASISYYPNAGFGFVLLFGGRTSPLANGTQYGDTWSYKLPVTVVVSASAPTIDLGESTHLTLAVTGGYPPYASYTWQGLPSPCSAGSVTAVDCAPGATGSYAILGSATDSGGFNGSSSPFALQVNPDPSATANASAYVAETQAFLNFSANLSGGTAPFGYSWAFGDGTTNTTSAPTHAFAVAGSYHVVLTVTDARNHTALAYVAPISITAPPAPLTATLTESTMSGVIPLTVDFAVLANGGTSPYSYAWTFGVPGATATSPMPSYTYSAAGTFPVQVIVTDSALGRVSQFVNISVTAPTPLSVVASASVTTGVAPLAVDFSATASGGNPAYTYAWTFEPSSTGSGATPSHTYATPGVFQAQVIATDALGRTASAFVTLTVLPALATSFTSSVGTPYCSQGFGSVAVTVHANATGGMGVDTFAWTFPNTTGTGANATTIVSTGSNWSIQLTTKDSAGHTATATGSVTAPPQNCVIPAAAAPAKTPWLLIGAIVLVGLVIVIELALLVRRRSK